jgi:hypothetical protein
MGTHTRNWGIFPALSNAADSNALIWNELFLGTVVASHSAVLHSFRSQREPSACQNRNLHPHRAGKELDAANRFVDEAMEAAGKQVDGGSCKTQVSGSQKTVETLSGDPSGSRFAQYPALQRQPGNMNDVL